MSRPKRPKPVKLVIGVFTNIKELFVPVTNLLTKEFGDIDLVSSWLPFDDTDYYENEMGTDLSRRLMAFKQLIDPEFLPEIKHKMIKIENEYSREGKRRINIDPGYLTHDRFVLATGKNYTHRIYIGSRIYADLTLTYQKGGFQTLPWTYPDYAKDNIKLFLMQVRNKYSIDVKDWAPHD
jgi:hypothetical protein